MMGQVKQMARVIFDCEPRWNYFSQPLQKLINFLGLVSQGSGADM